MPTSIRTASSGNAWQNLLSLVILPPKVVARFLSKPLQPPLHRGIANSFDIRPLIRTAWVPPHSRIGYTLEAVVPPPPWPLSQRHAEAAAVRPVSVESQLGLPPWRAMLVAVRDRRPHFCSAGGCPRYLGPWHLCNLILPTSAEMERDVFYDVRIVSSNCAWQ